MAGKAANELPQFVSTTYGTSSSTIVNPADLADLTIGAPGQLNVNMLHPAREFVFDPPQRKRIAGALQRERSFGRHVADWNEIEDDEPEDTDIDDELEDKEPDEMATQKRLIKVVIADPHKDGPMESSLLHSGDEQFTDLTDQELFFELPIKEMLDKHNETRTKIKKKGTKGTEPEYLEPARIRDLKMVVLTVAEF